MLNLNHHTFFKLIFSQRTNNHNTEFSKNNSYKKIKNTRLVHLAGESARFASRILYDSINVVMPVRLKAL